MGSATTRSPGFGWPPRRRTSAFVGARQAPRRLAERVRRRERDLLGLELPHACLRRKPEVRLTPIEDEERKRGLPPAASAANLRRRPASGSSLPLCMETSTLLAVLDRPSRAGDDARQAEGPITITG
jgi:hypothetical protein